MAEFHITLGSMFAGKSTELIKNYNNLINNGILESELLVINHISDKRYSNDSSICTHDGTKITSISLNNLSTIHTLYTSTYLSETVKYIFIDECQFFNDLYDVVKELLLKYKKKIYIYGLDGDYKQKPFYNSRMLDLIPFATTVQKKTSKCYQCNEPASCSKRLINSEEQIFIGGASEYQPVCLNHL